MSIAIRIALVLVAILLVVLVVRLIGRWQRPSHPPINIRGFAAEPGVVVFTSTDCSNCEEALAVVESLGVPLRQVTWELEPSVFEEVGVEAVPLTAVVNADQAVELLAAGVPRRASLRSAAQRAGLLD